MSETSRRMIIFDVDGTLVDSQDTIVAAMTSAFVAEGLVVPDRAEMLSIVGLSLPEAFRTLLPDHSADRIERMVVGYKSGFQNLRRTHGGESAAPMFAGARDLVLGLVTDGYMLGVATGKSRRGVDHFVTSHDLNGCFSVVQTADDAPSKPHPGMILNCLDHAGVDPGDAVIVGDTEFDMAMGRAAGVRRIGVSWGYHPTDRIQRGGAEMMARDMNELGQMVAELW